MWETRWIGNSAVRAAEVYGVGQKPADSSPEEAEYGGVSQLRQKGNIRRALLDGAAYPCFSVGR